MERVKINFDAPELNVAQISAVTPARDYEVPILVSLIELGSEKFHDPIEVENNWKNRYVKITSDDEKLEEIHNTKGVLKRLVFRNRHAFALVNLQKKGLIEKPEGSEIKRYKISEYGLEHLCKAGILSTSDEGILLNDNTEKEKADNGGFREELEDADQNEEIDLKEAYIETDKGSDRIIRELYNQWNTEKDLDLRPDFQRGYVWDNRMAGKLVESILLDVPIPIIYTAEDPDRPGKEIVIDGQQRLTAIFSFISGKFPDGTHFRLPNKKVMKFFPELSNKAYEEIEKEKAGWLKENFLSRKLRVVKILKKSNPDAKFMLFERLNTGARQLNDQELRNCVYHGAYNTFIKNISKNDDFQFCLNTSREDTRMRDVELVLRFFAFYHTNFVDFEPPMKKFLNNEMHKYRNISQEEQEKLEELFKKSVSLCRTIWGKSAFRRYSVGEDKNGYFQSNLNKALYEIVIWGFSKYDKHQVMKYQEAIFEELIYLQLYDPKFLDSIYAATNKAESIQYRFKTWWESLQRIMGTKKTEKRCFSPSLKKELYDKNQICVLCNSRINDIGDAEVDHIKHYWRGGESIPENARLVHRYCNKKRGGN